MVAQYCGNSTDFKIKYIWLMAKFCQHIEVRYLQKFYHKKKYAMMFSFFHIKVGGVNPIPFKVPDGNQ